MKKINIGSITAYNADYREILPMYDNKHFSLALLDPNYGIGVAKMAYTREKARPCKQKNGGSIIVKKKAYKQADWDDVAPDYSFFEQIVNISENQIIFGIDFFDWADRLGSGRIKWNKGFAEGMSFSSYERAYCSHIDNEREIDLLWAGFMQAKSLDEPMIQQGNKRKNEKRIHPTQKPTLLYRRLLLDYYKDGVVLDTHGGSFSSAVACLDLDIELVIIEKDIDYFNDGVNRLKEHYNKKQQMLQFEYYE